MGVVDRMTFNLNRNGAQPLRVNPALACLSARNENARMYMQCAVESP